MAAAENNSTRLANLPQESAAASEKDSTISQKAQSLLSKDPSWFKQTPDRGTGSAAYRKIQVPSTGMASENIKLPGLSRESSIEPERDLSAGIQPTPTTSWSGSIRGSNNLNKPATNARPPSPVKSPLPLLSSQRLEPPENASFTETVPVRSPAMSPSQGRISPDRMDRPVSPTKGLGGFVQSAMLKRSDSVNKRWSAQAVPGLSRGNSTTGTRSTHDASRSFLPSIGSGSGLNARASGLSRETSPVSGSRPGSSHSISIVTQQPDRDSTGTSDFRKQEARPLDFIKPALPDQNRSQPSYSQSEKPQITDDSTQDAPLSPSKVSDPKRWSPTKASWLESAINKPDSPKPKPAAPQQPSWMADLQRAKQVRSGVDLDKSTSQRELAVGGSLRSPAMGLTKSSSLGNVTSVPLSQSGQSVAASEQTSGFSKNFKLTSEREHSSSPAEASTTPSKPLHPHEPSSPALSQPSPVETISQTPNSTRLSEKNDKDGKFSIANKPKPATPPKKDFRPSLKARQVSSEKSRDNVPEFKNIFGKLKKTETKNYVAPDELKDNILRGKAGLTLTGGPKRTERRDDFKESLLKKKDDMKVKGGGSIKSKPPVKAPGESIVPEAIVKRRGLGTRGDSANDLLSQQPVAIPPNQSIADEKMSRQSVPEKKTSAPARLQEAPGDSDNLANRFNPALAGFLARGPPLITTSPGATISSPTEIIDNSTDFKGSQLVHTTKSRARGPKRRPPTSVTVDDGSKVPTDLSLESGSSRAFRSAALGTVATNTHKSLDIASTLLPSTKITTIDSRLQPTPKPGTPAKTLQPREEASAQSNFKHIPTPTTRSPSFAGSKNLISERSPPTKNEISSRNTVGLGITSPTTDNKYSTPTKSPKSPPIPAKKSEALSRIVSNGSLAPFSPPKTPKSLAPKTPQATALFSDFFNEEPKLKGKVDIDTQAILTKPIETTGKIKTLRKEIWEITADGKKTPVPPQQEHILYENCMYLCSHVFGTSNGKRTTEVYLWYGECVPSSSIEDVQLFCRNTAKDAGGKLIVLSQGKESSTFFEALGGIVITRRGSSSNSSATYMLCGRRHMGQIAFDEVDLSPKSLCSGFPFIIAAIGGNLYLWKGKGASADELGCARLIGMDLGLTGEIEEIDEGSEPSSFWKAFHSSDRPDHTANHWPLKASSDKYATRLFSVDVDPRPKSSTGFMWGRRTSTPSTEDSLNAQVTEISPYSQPDLTKNCVFVLDTFFEIYVYVFHSHSTFSRRILHLLWHMACKGHQYRSQR